MNRRQFISASVITLCTLAIPLRGMPTKQRKIVRVHCGPKQGLSRVYLDLDCTEFIDKYPKGKVNFEELEKNEHYLKCLKLGQDFTWDNYKDNPEYWFEKLWKRGK